jgi:hypothetical protein
MTTVGGQNSTAPWVPDATRDATLTSLRTACPKAQFPGLHAETAFNMVRGQPGFTPGYPGSAGPFVDNEADGLMYCRWNWSRF